jgi:hypothetical protein
MGESVVTHLTDPLATTKQRTSGNDAINLARPADVQGMGSAPNDLYGIWQSTTTSLVTNGGFKSGTFGRTALDSTMIVQDSTHVIFGSDALKVMPAVGSDAADYTVSVAANTTYTRAVGVGVGSRRNGRTTSTLLVGGPT